MEAGARYFQKIGVRIGVKILRFEVEFDLWEGRDMKLKIKRIYEKPQKEDGVRILVDRLWPRGLGKEDAQIDLWLKEIAPSDGLRKWFNHEPEKWDEFKRRYLEELGNKTQELETIRSYIKKGRVTLVFGAKDERYNNATALMEYLSQE